MNSVSLYFTILPIFIPPHCSVRKIQTWRWEVRVAPPRTQPLWDGDNAPMESELGACAWVSVGVADGHLWRCYAASEGIWCCQEEIAATRLTDWRSSVHEERNQGELRDGEVDLLLPSAEGWELKWVKIRHSIWRLNPELQTILNPELDSILNWIAWTVAVRCLRYLAGKRANNPLKKWNISE